MGIPAFLLQLLPSILSSAGGSAFTEAMGQMAGGMTGMPGGPEGAGPAGTPPQANLAQQYMQAQAQAGTMPDTSGTAPQSVPGVPGMAGMPAFAPQQAQALAQPALSPQRMMDMAQAMHFMQEGQEIQKRLKDPALNTTLIERFMAMKVPFAATGLQQKAEARGQLMKYQEALAKHLVDAGQSLLLPAIFRPLKPDEISGIAQAYMKHTDAQAQMKAFAQAPLREAYEAPVPYTGELASLLERYQSAGAATDRPPTTAEQSERVGDLLYHPDTMVAGQLAIDTTFGEKIGKNVQDQNKLRLDVQKAPTAQQQQEALDVWQRGQEADLAQKARNQAQDDAFNAAGTGTPTPVPTVPGAAPGQSGVAPQGTGPQTGTGQGQLPPGIFERADAAKVDRRYVQAFYPLEHGAPGVVSHKGAHGRGQIIATTGAMYGYSEADLKDEKLNEEAFFTIVRSLASPPVPGEKTRTGKDMPNFYHKTLGKPEAVFAAYFSGDGNVKDGKIINPLKNDGDENHKGTTTAEYVRRAMKAFHGAQANSTVAAPAEKAVLASPERLKIARQALTEQTKFVETLLADAEREKIRTGTVRADTTKRLATAQELLKRTQQRHLELETGRVQPAASAPAAPSAQVPSVPEAHTVSPLPAPVPSSASVTTPEPQLPLYQRSRTAGVRRDASGLTSRSYDNARQESAEVYVEQVMADNPRLIPAAVAEAARHGDTPSAPKMAHYRQVYSTGAYLHAVRSPEVAAMPEEARHDAALMHAAKADPSGTFDPELVKNFRNPVHQIQAAEVAKAQGERQVREQQTAQEVLKDDVERFVDTTTGRSILPTIPYLQVEQAQTAGTVVRLSKVQHERLEKVNEVIPIIAKIQWYTDRIYGPGGLYSHLTPETRVRTGIARGLNQLEQHYPELASANKFITANAEGLVRALKGVTGAATEGDVERALSLLPQMKSSLALSVWPPDITVNMPDTPAVALRTMDDLVETLNSLTGTILGNTQFAHGSLHRYTAQALTPAVPPVAAPPSLRAPWSPFYPAP